MSRAGLQLATKGINLPHFPVYLIKAEDFNLVNSQIRNQNVLLIVCHSGTGNMRTEGPFRNGADPLVIDTVNDISHRTVRIQSKKGGLSVMISGNHKVLPALIYCQVASSHSADISGIQLT